MAGTRSSARQAARSSSPSNGDDTLAGSKRKPDAEPEPKRSSKATKKQTTIEETIGKQDEDHDMKDAQSEHHEASDDESKEEGNSGQDDTKLDATDIARPKPSNDDVEKEAFEKVAGSTNDNNAKQDSSEGSERKEGVDGEGAIEKSSQREKQMPSNILEKGIIYFFTRNRVGVDEADSVGDLQRTFFVLRPLPVGAKLGDGAIQDLENNRLFALPKKTFPKSHSDRYMAFVEKAKTTIKDLKENFFQGSEYETKTQGTRQVDPMTPVAEGVYAITRTENATTHLVYSTTIPDKLGEMQEDLGIRDQGSFVISVKNPERSGPAAAQLPQKPDFPKEIIEEFRGLAWSEVKPKYIDYEYCQILLIGEKVEKALEPTKKNQKHDKETPQEELEKLEHEDELRVQHLHGDDSVFDDLQISKKDYPTVPTTW